MQEIHDNLHHRVITVIEVQRLVVLGITALGNGASMMIGIMDPPRVFIFFAHIFYMIITDTDI